MATCIATDLISVIVCLPTEPPKGSTVPIVTPAKNSSQLFSPFTYLNKSPCLAPVFKACKVLCPTSVKPSINELGVCFTTPLPIFFIIFLISPLNKDLTPVLYDTPMLLKKAFIVVSAPNFSSLDIKAAVAKS